MDEKGSIHEAFAISGGKLLYVGDLAGTFPFKGVNTQSIDLKGKSVLPGLGDAHLHASSTCELIFSFDMYDIGLPYDAGPQDAIALYRKLIAENLQKDRNAVVLRGTGWDPAYFMADPEMMPTAADIDQICPDIPVILRSYDHHYIWVNSKVLRDSGITRDTPTPRNGVIWKDENGEPTGIFQENPAIDLLLRNVPYGDYTVNQYEEGILYYQKNFGNAYGTTFIFDALATENAISAYRRLAENDRLSMRVAAVYAVDPTRSLSQLDDILDQIGRDDVEDIFCRNTVKVFVDGTGLSIYMDEPYEEAYLKKIGMEKGYRGYPQWTMEELTEIFTKINGAGIPVHAHCMGDGAVRLTLDAMEAAQSAGADISSARNTIAHFMAIRSKDKERMAKLGIIANVQPIWGCYYSMTENIITEMLGDERARAQYPLGSFKSAGVKLAAGTDFPVTIPPNPFLGFKIGTTRTIDRNHPEYDLYKDSPLGPREDPMSEAVGLEDMIAMYSSGAAYQVFLEDEIGSLEEGKSADFIVLDKRITDVDPEDLDTLKAESVYFKGKKIF